MTLPRNSSKYGTVQPPSVKLPLVSSVGPPGPCMTPSRLMKVRTIIFLMEGILPEATHHACRLRLLVIASLVRRSNLIVLVKACLPAPYAPRNDGKLLFVLDV